MTEAEHLLVCLMEECSEVQKLAAKALRFGPQEVWPTYPELGSNEERLRSEWNDLMAIVEMLKTAGVLNLYLDNNQIEAKKVKVRHYMAYAREQCGTLNDQPNMPAGEA